MRQTNLAWAIALWMCLTAGGSVVRAQDPEEPIALTRVLLTPEQFAQEWSKSKPGSLVRMRSAEFEQLLTKAGQAKTSVRPRLLETRYRAELVGTMLVGQAEWKTLNPNPMASVLPIESFSLAVRRIVWSDNQPALLAPFEAVVKQGLGLLLPETGQRSLVLDWSAAGNVEPDGVRFDLALPVCLLGSLELETPNDRVVLPAGRGTFVTQPYLPQRRTWRVVPATGSASLSFVVRPKIDSNTPPLVRTRTMSKISIEPTQVVGEFEFATDVVRGTVNELSFHYDPAVYPVEVRAVGATVESWQASPGKPGQAGTLKVVFGEPFEKGKVTVRTLSPPPLVDQTWSTIAVRPLGCLSLGESLLLRLHPQLRLEDFRPAEFRLTNAISDAERWVNYSLESDIPSATTQPSIWPLRPSARLRTQGLELRVMQTGEWRVSAERSLLKTTIRGEVQAGLMRQLPILLPTGYKLLGLTSDAEDLLAGWTVKGDPATLLIELARTVRAGQTVSLTVELAGPAPQPTTRVDGSTLLSLPIPDLLTPSALSRSGSLAVFVSPTFAAHVQANLAPASKLDQPDGPIASYSFRAQGLEGRLYLSPRSSRYQVQSQTTVELGQPTSIRTQLTVQPQSGAVRQLLIRQLRPHSLLGWSGNWRVTMGNCLVQSERPVEHLDATPHLLALASSDPLAAVGTLALADSPEQTRWLRLTLDRPINTPITLERRLTAEFPLWSPREQALAATRLFATGPTAWLAALSPPVRLGGGTVEPWAVPLTVFPESQSQQHRVSVVGLPMGWEIVRRVGLSLHSANNPVQAGDANGVVHLIQDDLPSPNPPGPTPQLWLGPSDPQPEQPCPSRIESAELVAALYPGQGILCQFRCQLQLSRSEWSCPIRLPTGVIPVSLMVNQRTLELSSWGSQSNDGHEALLPLPAGRHTIQAVYVCPQSAWFGRTTLHAPAPTLAVPLPAMRRVWRLPAGVRPTADDLWIQTDGVDQTKSVSAQRQADLHAIRRLSSKYLKHVAEADYPLYDSRSKLAPAMLVGLAGAPMAHAQPQPWPIGLFHHQAVGQLWTDAQRRSQWLMQTRGRGMPECVRSALEQAATDGHDAQGRFLLWPEGMAASTTVAQDDLAVLAEATEWVAASGVSIESSIDVVDVRGLDVAGWIVGVAWLLALLWYRSRSKPSSWLGRLVGWLILVTLVCLPMILGLAAVVASAVWLPLLLPTVWLAGVVVFAKSLRWLWSRKTVAFTAVTLPLLGVALASQTNAQPVLAPVVYILDTPNQQERTVLVPLELHKQLEQLVRKHEQPVAGAMLMNAQYVGKVEGEVAVFEGRFGVYAYTDEPTVIKVPLTGVLLGEVRLDGAAAHPQVAAPTDRFFSVQLKGRGSHQLLFRFSVPIRSNQLGQELRFGVPDLPTSQLVLDLPADVRLLSLGTGRGWRQLRPHGQGQRLEMDLGRIPVVELGFGQTGPQSEPTVRVQEASLWRITPAQASVTTALKYEVVRGSLGRIMVDVPRELEVVQVQVRSLDKTANAQLRNWSLADGPTTNVRRLSVNLQEPSLSGVLLLLECSPRSPPTRQLTIRFPQSTERGNVESRQALQLGGLGAIELDAGKLMPIPVEEFVKEAWRPLSSETNPPVPTRAFRRDPKQADLTSVRLFLQPSPTATRGVQELLWQVGPDRVELQATARINAANPNLSLLEWELPNQLQVHQLDGVEVRTWTRTGNRLQVWLNRPVAETTITLIGTFVWSGIKPNAPVKLELPGLRLSGVTLTSKVVVRSQSSLVLRLGERRNLAAAPNRSNPDDIALETRSDDFGLSVLVWPAESAVSYRLTTQIQPIDRAINWISTLKLQPRVDQVGQPHRFELVLRGWSGQPPRLLGHSSTQTYTVQTTDQVANAEIRWRVEVPSLPAEGFDLDLQGRLDGASEFVAPAIDLLHSDGLSIGNVPHLYLLAPGLSVSQSHRLRRLEQLPAEFEWLKSSLADRATSLWLTTDAQARLHLALSSLSIDPTNLTPVELADHVCTFDGERWLYRSRWLLRTHAPARLSIRLAQSGEGLNARLNGNPLAISKDLTLPPGIHQIAYWWQSSPTPRYDPLRLSEPTLSLNSQLVRPTTTVWTVLTQGDTQLARPAGPAALRPLTLGEVYLRVALSAQTNQPPLATALLQQAAGYARLAELQLQTQRVDEQLAERLNALRTQTKHIMPVIHPLLAQDEPYAVRFVQASPQVWVLEPGQAAPVVEFVPSVIARQHTEVLLLILLICVCGALLIALTRQASLACAGSTTLGLMVLCPRPVQLLALVGLMVLVLTSWFRQATRTATSAPVSPT